MRKKKKNRKKLTSNQKQSNRASLYYYHHLLIKTSCSDVWCCFFLNFLSSSICISVVVFVIISLLLAVSTHPSIQTNICVCCWLAAWVHDSWVWYHSYHIHTHFNTTSKRQPTETTSTSAAEIKQAAQHCTISVIKWRHSLFDSQTVNDGYFNITAKFQNTHKRKKLF